MSKAPSTAQSQHSSLVLGATGATGKWLCDLLLKDGVKVTAIVRSRDRLPENIQNHANLTIVEHPDPLKMDKDEWKRHLAGVDSVASCLGHNLTFKGVYLPPYLLCHDTAKKVVGIMDEMNQTSDDNRRTRFILMNTVGNFNYDLQGKGETFTWGQTALTGVLRWLVPPQNDNERAANFFRTQVGKPGTEFPTVDWAVVRPDSLTDCDAVSDVAVFPSPTRNWLSNPGKTTRINCAWFMKELMMKPPTFDQWKFQMPCVYNKEDS